MLPVPWAGTEVRPYVPFPGSVAFARLWLMRSPSVRHAGGLLHRRLCGIGIPAISETLFVLCVGSFRIPADLVFCYDPLDLLKSVAVGQLAQTDLYTALVAALVDLAGRREGAERTVMVD